MDEIPVQKRDHFFIRALLGRKDCRRALRAVHRVVDVAHGSDGAAGKKALSFCRIVGHDLFERVSGRHKAFALLVIELCSERCGSAGAGVVGAAAAETDDDVFAALLHGIANQAADTEGRRLRGVFVLADHRKSSRLRHFNERGAVLNAVGGRYVFLPRTADAALDFLRAQRADEAVDRSLSAVCHRNGQHLAAGHMALDRLLGNLAELQRRHGSLERIRNDNTLFHTVLLFSEADGSLQRK